MKSSNSPPWKQRITISFLKRLEFDTNLRQENFPYSRKRINSTLQKVHKVRCYIFITFTITIVMLFNLQFDFAICVFCLKCMNKPIRHFYITKIIILREVSEHNRDFLWNTSKEKNLVAFYFFTFLPKIIN